METNNNNYLGINVVKFFFVKPASNRAIYITIRLNKLRTSKIVHGYALTSNHNNDEVENLFECSLNSVQ